MFVCFGLSFSYLFTCWLQDQIQTPEATVCCTMARRHWVFASTLYFSERHEQRKHQSKHTGTRRTPKKNEKKRKSFLRQKKSIFSGKHPEPRDQARRLSDSAEPACNGEEIKQVCLLLAHAFEPVDALPVRIPHSASVEPLNWIIPLAFDTFLDMIISLLAVYQ